MIGVGPFITLPLLLSAMGGPQAMLGWLLGALLALCDGLVWAELGATLPGAGGTFHFLREIFPGNAGRYLAFLFLFQLLLSAPLSIASGALGLGNYASWLVPSLLQAAPPQHTAHLGPVSASIVVSPLTAVGIAAILLALVLLFRRLRWIEHISLVLATVVLSTIGLVLFSALLSPAGHLSRALTLPPHAFALSPAFLGGLASSMLIATYDYWGYYNVTFLGEELRDPARTIPRAIVGSIFVCFVLYLLLTLAVLSTVPWQTLVSSSADPAARRAVISVFMLTAWTPLVGSVHARLLSQIITVLVILTAFSSIFSLLLGYSRIPFAAAREGLFFRSFGRLHPTRRLPTVSLCSLAGIAMLCSFLSLAEVIAALVVVRILLQFLLQHIGVLYLRHSQPERPRPFRLWLYPLPPVLAILGFTYILFGRPHVLQELALAAVIAVAGTLAFLLQTKLRGSNRNRASS